MSGVSENKPPLNCMLAGGSIPIVLEHFPWAGKGSEERGAMAEDKVAAAWCTVTSTSLRTCLLFVENRHTPQVGFTFSTDTGYF